MTVLPSWMYGDPAEFMDRQRKLSEIEQKRAERKKAQERKHKRMRIVALTKKAMEGRR